jgi:arylsulfatase A-like enzyme
MKKNNIIFICTDGVRRDVIQNFRSLNKLSNTSSYFPKVITYAPYTIASLHSIFTGIYGSRNGVDNYYGEPNFKSDKCKTITSYLKDEGYYTIGDILNEIVVPHVGFEELTIASADKDILPRHKDIIKKCGSLKKSNKNFFAFLHCDYVHNSLVSEVAKVYDDFSKKYFGNIDHNRINYISYVKKIDRYLDVILSDIQNEDIMDSIIVIFSDHGCSLGERLGEKIYGSFCYDYTIMTYSMFLHETLFPKIKFTQLIRTVDYMPTILDALNIPIDKNNIELDGKSLVSIMDGSELQPRIGFCETGGLGGPYPSPNAPNVHCVRTEKWKLIFNRTPKTYELYKVDNDPDEQNNLFGQESFQTVQKELLRELRTKILKLEF